MQDKKTTRSTAEPERLEEQIEEARQQLLALDSFSPENTTPHYDEIRHKEEIHKRLLNLVISAQEEERKRIARELHDETCQALTSLTVELETAIAMLPADSDRVKAMLKGTQSLAAGTLDEIHRIIHELRPALLDDLGLLAAVRWHVETHLEAAGVRTSVEATGTDRRLPPQIEITLFRVAQEAVTNIAKHASAESTRIAFAFSEDSAAITIEDDGKGFDAEEVMTLNDGRHGLGLISMKERVELLGGVFSIKSLPGDGTQISIEIPISQEVADVQDTGISSR